MSLFKGNIINNIFKRQSKDHIIEKLQEDLEQLNENCLHAQRLANFGSWSYDFKKNNTFWSDEIYNILESNPDELKNNLEDFYKFIHTDDLDKVMEFVRYAMDGREYNIEYRIITSKGKEKFLQEKSRVLNDENKSPIKIIGIIEDITEQKLIENDLRAFGEELNLAQKVAGVGSWKYDSKKDEIFWTEEMYRIYNVEPSECKKSLRGILELIHIEDRLKVDDAIKNCLKGKSYKIEHRIPQKNGLFKYVINKGEPIYNDGQVTGILGTLEDITEVALLKKELEKRNKLLTKAETLAHLGSWELNIVKNKALLSSEAYKILDISPEEFDGTYEGILKIIYPEDVHIIEKMVEFPSIEPFHTELRILRRDGSIRHVFQIIEFVFDNDDKPIYIYGTIQDITEKRKLEKRIELKQEEIMRLQKRYEVLVRESSDVFEIVDQDGTIKYVSEAVERIIGYKPNEMIGKKALDFYTGEDIHKRIEMFEFILSNPNKKAKGDLAFITKKGEKIYLEVIMQNLINDPVIEGIVINFRDITKRIEMEKRMTYISTHDRLTDLPNSIYCSKKLRLQCQHAREKRTRFALMMLDIEGLKYINYSLGYEMGNMVIIEILERLKKYLGEETFISKYSEDNFAILIQGLKELGDYESIAKGIIDLFSKPYRIKSYEINVDVNLGISVCPKDGDDAESLKKQSKIALIRAKKEGKNTYKFYSSDLDIKNYKEFILRSDLHNAIKKDQLYIVYQPIINLKNNDILGAEALLRWEHPDWGIVNPHEFIPLAEETGLIIQIGKWVLRQVCENYRNWLKAGLPAIKVAVNFSGIQFFEKNFTKNIKDIIDEFQLNPNFLIIEITESILIENTDKIIHDLETLQSYGIQVAIDDFGTGFSSLSYLNSFDVDILKLDSSFIKKVPVDGISTSITKSIINLGRELKIKLVAEGIENWDQLTYLKSLNCYTGQGYIFSKPLSSMEFEKILAKRKCRPVLMSDISSSPREERRKFFRINFHQLLEGNLTILELKGRKINVGSTKILIKNIGPGGLCFVSNIKFPTEKDIVLQFATNLLEKEIKVYGHLVWTEDIDYDLYEYGVEFTIDENERMDLIRDLNQVQIKMRKNDLFAEGSFISGTYAQYFNNQ